MRKWSFKEIETLKSSYGLVPIQDLEVTLGRPKNAIYLKAKELNLTEEKSDIYTKEECRYILDNFKKIPTAIIASKLQRTEDAIEKKFYKLKFYEKKDTKILLSEYKIIKSILDLSPSPYLAETLGLSVNYIDKIKGKLNKIIGTYKQPNLKLQEIYKLAEKMKIGSSKELCLLEKDRVALRMRFYVHLPEKKFKVKSLNKSKENCILTRIK